MEITYYGHSCFEIKTSDHRLLFDPFISPNELAKDINPDNIDCDFMLITHGHEDHVADAESIAKRCNPTIISNFEIVSWFEGKGFEKVHPMNHGGNWSFDFGKVKYVNAVHSSVLPDGTYGGNPGGFILEIEGKKIYNAGDTALHMDMKLIGEYDQPDVAILPIGDNFTMGIRDAIRAAEFIKCDKIIGVHYDTFPYVEIDHEEAKAAFKAAGKELTLMKIGSSQEL
jgi:L-ascorbate metabolism protein UlaG (beta-lactamase superfamily)